MYDRVKVSKVRNADLMLPYLRTYLEDAAFPTNTKLILRSSSKTTIRDRLEGLLCKNYGMIRNRIH